MRLLALPIIALVLAVFFTVPNQNGVTIFDATQTALSEYMAIRITSPESPKKLVVNSHATSTPQNVSVERGTTTTSASSSETQANKTKEDVPIRVLGTEEKNDTPLPGIDSYTGLSLNGIFEWTNYYRQVHGLPPLSLNAKLMTAATLKVNDMFKNQYFEHVSPEGRDVSDVVTDLGYEYIAVGENLALGNFESSKDLVDAWMASPGHRANILNKSYEEIGLAIKFSEFEGRKVWLATQEFGKPRSSCPSPSQQLKSRISIWRGNVSDFSDDLEVLRVQLEKMNRSDVSKYNEKVDEYNALAKRVNTLNEELKSFIEAYNTQVDAFNDCASGAVTEKKEEG